MNEQSQAKSPEALRAMVAGTLVPIFSTQP